MSPALFGSSAVIPPPAHSVVTLYAPAQGGFNPWSVPGSVYGGGKVFFSFCAGTSGSIAVAQYDVATSAMAGATLYANLEKDDHDSPALLIRSSDSRLVAVYAKHNGSAMYVQVSTNPLDATAWGARTNIDSQLGGSGYTDMQLHEIGGTIYLFYRDEPVAGTDSRWCLSTSADGGATWAAQTIIYRVTSHRSYVVSWSDGTTIHFVGTNSTAAATHVIGHFYWQGGAWYKSDGTSLGSPPFDETDLTTIYSGSDYAQMSFVAIGSGTPVCTYGSLNGTTVTFYYARWSGAAWVSTLLSTTGVYNYNTGAGDGFYGWAPQDDDINTVYAIKTVAGQPEVFSYVTADSGATFTETQITSGTSGFIACPIPVRFRSGAAPFVLWQYGTWTNYTTYSLGTRAY